MILPGVCSEGRSADQGNRVRIRAIKPAPAKNALVVLAKKVQQTIAIPKYCVRNVWNGGWIYRGAWLLGCQRCDIHGFHIQAASVACRRQYKNTFPPRKHPRSARQPAASLPGWQKIRGEGHQR